MNLIERYRQRQEQKYIHTGNTDNNWHAINATQQISVRFINNRWSLYINGQLVSRMPPYP